MKGIIAGLESIITLFKTIFGIIMSMFNAMYHLFQYVLKIPIIFGQIQIAFPSWLKGFIILSLSIALVYIILGRVGGKSD